MERVVGSARSAKRIMDIVGAASLLVLFSPIIAVIAVAILVTDGRPVLFRQVRPGRHGEPFTLVKFRTMRDPHPGEEPWTTDDVRTTRLGRFLRRTSLDELPELALVLTGRMSLVGPRPLVMEYLPRYSAHHARRHEVRPGITGLTQVSGRRSLTFGQRLDLDVEYIDTWSLRLDLAILLRTLAEPFRRGEIRGQTLAEVDDVGLVPPVLERVP
ncbi:sugar transferase [Micromonospora sp. PPF5-17]|uniref:Sugar transferase n=1 Tax=Micromonospora solifontis TaxID=2487138 RepID=A0ABX9WK51_9ACTN|nr:sugar transferase [Micromonospora sp. PPF5-17B]NES35855.1 sugar transferase [Micromonospora solifontis]NES57993.1 sugar transferase [Micromonospora sp. PPF5-6]RNM00329.1 sugar transferase [Micromonospora solifontis]